MTQPLRVGIIGLGRCWRKRYRPALLKLSHQFEIHSLCDSVFQKAINEAHRLGCQAASGPTQLLENEDIDAVLILDPQWYRLWPLEAACRAGKPVFCCVMPDTDEPHADVLYRLVQEARLLVMPELVLQFTPAALRLRELLESQLGQPQAVLAEVVEPTRRISPQEQLAHRDLVGSSGIRLLSWCADILGGQPISLLSGGSPGRLFTLLLEFGKGKAAHVTYSRETSSRRSLRLRIVADRGSVTVEPPNRLLWNDSEGRHALTLCPREPIGQVLLERFHRAVCQGQRPDKEWAEVHEILGWLKAAARSQEEGKRIALT